MALLLAVILSGVFLFHGEPSFSPEDYVYSALGGDARAMLAFASDWRQDNYRPLSHALVYFAMSPLYLTFGAIAYAWLITLLKAICAVLFYFVLRSWKVSRGVAVWATLFLLVTSWRLLHLWNALAINVLLLQIAACLFLLSLRSGRQRLWLLVLATIIGSGSYSLGALFPVLYFFIQRVRFRIWSWRDLLLSLPFGLPGWICLANGVLRAVGVSFQNESPSFFLSHHPILFKFEAGSFFTRLLLSSHYRMAAFFPLFKYLPNYESLGAMLFLFMCAMVCWASWSSRNFRYISITLLALLLIFSIPFFLITPAFLYLPRYNWPVDLFFCALLGVALQGLLDRGVHRMIVYSLACVWAAGCLFFPPPSITETEKGMREFRLSSVRLEELVKIEDWKKDDLYCLPLIPMDGPYPPLPPMSPWSRHAFVQETLMGMTLLQVLKAKGDLSAVLELSNFRPHCRVELNLLDGHATVISKGVKP